MSSSWQTICDALANDLTGNIPRLAGAKVHLYSPVAPDLGDATDNTIHVSVSPALSETETIGSEPGPYVTTGSRQLIRLYTIAVWEKAAEVEGRQLADPEADAAWLELYEEIEDRLFVEANTQLGGASPIWAISGNPFGEVQGLPVRLMAFQLRAVQPKAFT